MDGVIIDSEPLHFEVDMKTMAQLGSPISKESLEAYVGMTNPEMWTLIKKEYNLSQTVFEIIDLQLGAKLAYLRETEVTPIPGIRELLKELHERHIPIGLASSSPRVFIEAVLKKLEVSSYFTCIVSAEEVAKGKPAPDVYLEAAHQMNVSPAACWVLEDSRNGLKAARAAGMKCIGFINPNSGNQDLSAADIIVSTITEISVAGLT
ncbi:HAD family hydrolase [Paenibacillus hexagrammi]|uniref:HAD family hydrolase n=2 Tax=Paenibacillus hexagrammi TaxID=2908839 RepID=A0ABY3STQ6_9BACL|nr:HAD family hydrolase [Paenibacillus sp. YPD9-1]